VVVELLFRVWLHEVVTAVVIPELELVVVGAEADVVQVVVEDEVSVATDVEFDLDVDGILRENEDVIGTRVGMAVPANVTGCLVPFRPPATIPMAITAMITTITEPTSMVEIPATFRSGLIRLKIP
jgi:hypothetical protein